jgi:hypothetical protein
MESENELGNELGAVKYVSELTGSPVENIANIFILLIIFVFDPLAIVLIIATNQAFKHLKPEEEYIEYIEPEDYSTEPQPIFTQSNNIEQEKQRIIQEIKKIERSGASSRKSGPAIQSLQNQLKGLENTKTY